MTNDEQKSSSKEASEKRIRRREALKTMLATGIAAATAAEAQAPEAQTTAKPAEDALTVEDLAAADKLAAHNYTDEDRKLMLRSVTETRKALTELRAVKLDPTLDPATRFDPC